MTPADVQSARPQVLSPPPVSPDPAPGPLARRLADAAAERAAHALVGYRVRPSLFGPRLWVLRLDASDALLRDLAWSPRKRLRNGPGEELARAILAHWLDREPAILLVTRFRVRFLERLTGPEFTIPAAAVRGFLAAQGVS
jgi:hypothetical protein